MASPNEQVISAVRSGEKQKIFFAENLDSSQIYYYFCIREIVFYY